MCVESVCISVCVGWGGVEGSGGCGGAAGEPRQGFSH